MYLFMLRLWLAATASTLFKASLSTLCHLGLEFVSPRCTKTISAPAQASVTYGRLGILLLPLLNFGPRAHGNFWAKQSLALR